MKNKAIDRTRIFKKYQNQWVAFSDGDRVISSGTTLHGVLAKAGKKGFKDPCVAKIPDQKYDYMLSLQ